MQARNRTWLLGSNPVERCRQRTMNVEGGDGSTLSLDFTTGVLDPRLTFTRSTNATFINSQGLVAFAAANILRNSVMAGGSTSGLSAPTSWSAGASGESYRTQIVIDGCEQWKQVASSTRPYMTIAISNTELAVGVQYVASVYVDSFTTGTLFATLDNFFSYNEPSGTTVSSVTWVAPNGSTGASQPLAIGRIQLRFVLSAIGASGFQFRIGIGVQNAATGTVEFSRPQCERGTVAKPFLANTSTSAANYNTPRFDYDPTTTPPTPRGLLIEASANNLVTQSNGATSVWTIGGNRTPTNNTTDLLSPDETNNATKLVCGTATSYASYSTTITGLTGGGTYTVSYWIRGPVGHTPRLYALNGTIGDVTPTVTTGTYNNTGWTRLTQTYTLPATTTQVYVYFMSVGVVVTGDTFYVYGFQLETGSGASSLIPSGASTGFRAADSCVMTGTNFSSWFNAPEGTFIAQFQTQHQGNTSSAAYLLALDSSASKRLIYLNTDLDTASTFDGTLVISAVGDVTGVLAKVASAYNSSERAIVANGGAVATGSVAVGYSSATSLGIGLLTSNSTFKQIKFFPTRLSNSQLQVLTA